ncbi:hypothetical protein CYLTODRAFT_439478 [Cylindrobasidium torrendii FP15055 ss-10]|uniref:Uncharacterized protein n=1 Tax=Cylindrobasidium torrendii FP15055 ss-10 TaxID=1314674 RepID=A0A0D7BVL3_9AGAR|nr:hypothetical protein CYLTODRAFT_439478 [Cylindrobasidium torrendii FP15055 ss-10]
MIPVTGVLTQRAFSVGVFHENEPDGDVLCQPQVVLIATLAGNAHFDRLNRKVGSIPPQTQKIISAEDLVQLVALCHGALTVPAEASKIQAYNLYTQKTALFDNVQELLNQETPDWLGGPIENLAGKGIWIGLRSAADSSTASLVAVEASVKRFVVSVTAYAVDGNRSPQFALQVSQTGKPICFFTGDGIFLDCMHLIPRPVSSAVLAETIARVQKQFPQFHAFCVNEGKTDLLEVQTIPAIGDIRAAVGIVLTKNAAIIDQPVNGQFANKAVHWGIDKECYFAQLGQRRVALATGPLRVVDVDFAFDRTILNLPTNANTAIPSSSTPSSSISNPNLPRSISSSSIPFLLPRQEPFVFEEREELGRYLLINMRDSYSFHYHFGTQSFWKAVNKIAAKSKKGKRKRSMSEEGSDDDDNDGDGKPKRHKGKQIGDAYNTPHGRQPSQSKEYVLQSIQHVEGLVGELGRSRAKTLFLQFYSYLLLDGVSDLLDIVQQDAVKAFDNDLPEGVDPDTSVDSTSGECRHVLRAFDVLAAKVMQGEEVNRTRTEVRKDMEMLQQKTRFYVYMAIMSDLNLKDTA